MSPDFDNPLWSVTEKNHIVALSAGKDEHIEFFRTVAFCVCHILLSNNEVVSVV